MGGVNNMSCEFCCEEDRRVCFESMVVNGFFLDIIIMKSLKLWSHKTHLTIITQGNKSSSMYITLYRTVKITIILAN